MSRISLWVSIALFLAGCAWAVAMEIGKEWFTQHALVVWWLFGAAALFLVLAIAEYLYGRFLKKHKAELAAQFERGRASVSQTQGRTPEQQKTIPSTVEPDSGIAVASNPGGVARITGAFYNVRIIRYGVISGTAHTNRNQWMLCGFRIQLALSVRGAARVEARDISLRTYKDKPTCRALPSLAPPQLTTLEEQYSGQTFEAYPEIIYHYEGRNELPESLELVVTDQFQREHIIHLRDGEQLPSVPDQRSERS